MDRAVRSAIDQVTLDPAWPEVLDVLYSSLAQCITAFEANPSACQVVLGLCGETFQMRYYPQTRSLGYLVREPYMSNDTLVALTAQLHPRLLASVADHMASTRALERPCFHHLLRGLEASIQGARMTTRDASAIPTLLAFLARAFVAPSVHDPLLDVEQARHEASLLQQCLLERANLDDTTWRLKASQTLLGVSEPWRSPVAPMLSRLVRDAIRDDFPQYSEHDGNLTLQNGVEGLLNQHYVLTRSHSAFFVALALPIASVWPEKSGRDLDLLSAFARLLETHVHHPMRGDAVAGSQRIWRRLAAEQPALYQHIEGVFGDVPAAKKRLAMLEAPSELFVGWLQVSLVGYLRKDVLHFVWDQVVL
ncbi:hypothetical protein SPRG_01546 [Saprolegnia parasitica CBS 223.65]|uniref:Uncharacterized protein n=1 Tax=Saprolegnia parasitica (strain CBS 223.65) TaxID=695850 RepID=A0A067CYS0_SAPPC|nr:hypothetical protein SPRG_01546 [Saprolegnia parasitica CBS 223.65]KDO34410.1 hypothetical protein SPRG_01546 [Saprolegnia parasitica CBS 223.65]|eukprot:XP_012195144.1 hypothetical protein SPRG_01546 [Saprolegnia parasitica CBS 223.65]